jgi:hypothetical protein
MALTPAEQKQIAEGAEQIRRKQEAEVERQKTQEFKEMRKRNEARPPQKPMPSAGEFAKEKIKQGAKRFASGVDSFVSPPPTKRNARKKVALGSGQYLGTFKPARGRRPPAQQGFFGSGSMGMPEFRGDLLGGFGAQAPRRKKGKDGWGLL